MYAYFEDCRRNIELANYVNEPTRDEASRFCVRSLPLVVGVIYITLKIIFRAKQKAALDGSLSGEIDTKNRF